MTEELIFQVVASGYQFRWCRYLGRKFRKRNKKMLMSLWTWPEVPESSDAQASILSLEPQDRESFLEVVLPDLGPVG